MKFKEKVESMDAHEIVDAMIQGIRKEHVKLRFYTFGESDDDGVCYGCGATNAICEINREKFDTYSIGNSYVRADFLRCDLEFLDSFESAIDNLRIADVGGFVNKMQKIGVYIKMTYQEIDEWEYNLQMLSDTIILHGKLDEVLVGYEEFRDWLKDRGM